MIRIIPNIPKIKAHWERRTDDIPTYLEVPMSNGTTVNYFPDIVQPGFVAAMKNIENMANMVIGYPKIKE